MGGKDSTSTGGESWHTINQEKGAKNPQRPHPKGPNPALKMGWVTHKNSKRPGMCATGFQEGEIKWDDEDTKNDNRQHEPFLLLRHSSRCQVVLSMRVTGEWLFWDCEDQEHKNSYNGEVPTSFITKDVKIHYCYYEKQ